MRERLQKFSLSLHPEKTRLLEFGRHAATNRKRRGFGKPETFNFLGFTFICGKSLRGRFLLKRRSRRDRMKAKLKEVAGELNASVNPSARDPAEASRHWLLCLPCSPNKLGRAGCLSTRDHRAVVVGTPPPQPKECSHLGANAEAG
jgi:hypothetical protein